MPPAQISGPKPMKRRGPEPHRQPADAPGEEEHHDRDRHGREAAAERRVAGELLEEQHEEEAHRRERRVDGQRLEIREGEVPAPEERERKHRLGGAPLPAEEEHEEDEPAEERHRGSGGLPKPRFGASISANTGPLSPSTQRAPPRTSTRARRSVVFPIAQCDRDEHDRDDHERRR